MIWTTKVASGAKELALGVHFVKFPNAILSSIVHKKTTKVCAEALSVLSDVNWTRMGIPEIKCDHTLSHQIGQNPIISHC